MCGRPGGTKTRRAISFALIAIVVATGLVGTYKELEGLRDNTDNLRALPRDHGRVIPQYFGGSALGFIDFVRATIPAGDTFRLRLPQVSPIPGSPPGHFAWPPGTCQYLTRAGIYHWLVYSLVPRVLDCTSHAKWTVYFNVPPGSSPPGSNQFVYKPGYVVIERGSA